ncbi:uncharacterized protein LOC122829606 isoform X2 [Gambusia affinis]|uniref:uncharacterized protein LOC122829606 isoform X2 n=1 Tax=Gambusia affinis TaxID=33528 RepID=UPI001CDC519F|nr:uncharacterized protein LOC122829606 isoform X2 [Gambusia affinis]
MEESNGQMNRSIHISIDNLEDIILPRLNTLTPAQWTLLSQGLRDSHITAVMADILTNIFQQCVENSLTVLVPILEDCMTKCMKTKMPDESISVHLTNMISTEMAIVLEVSPPEEVCESSMELNSLMEQEVSEKVTSIANGIKRTSSFPAEPAVFASGCISNLRNFNKMVSNAVQCLRKHINRVSSRCIERYWSAFTKKRTSGVSPAEAETAFDLTEKSVSPSVKSLYSVASVSESIAEIIEKYSDDAGDAKGAEDDADFCLDHFEVNEVAGGISKTIIDDLHYCKAEGSVGQKDPSCSCAPHFNLKKIVGDIRNLFRSKGKTDPAGKEEIVKNPQFSRFAKDQFATMASSLEISFKDSSDTNVVKLKQDVYLSNTLAHLMFPGCVPEDSSGMKTDQIPKLDFQSIKPQIDRLCAEFMKNPQLNDKIKQFSKELTDKLYTDITSSHHYNLPVPPENLSESVLSSEKISDISGQTEICPEIFYARTEDEVRRFLQNIFLWLKNEEINRISESDRVSNVLSEINDLVGQTYETQIPKPMSPGTEKDSIPTIGREFKEQPEYPVKAETDSLIDSSLTAPGIRYVRFVEEITIIPIPEINETTEQKKNDLEECMKCFAMRAFLNCWEKNGGPVNTTDMKRILSYLPLPRSEKSVWLN